MTARRRLFMTLLASLAIAGGVYAVISRPAAVIEKKGRWAGGEGPVPVRVAIAANTDVPVYLEAVGTARALNTVSVQPQVGGKLIEVAFREGQTVEKGQVLARIDPSTYQATLDQAKAKLAQDESQLANAKVDLERYERIPGAIPVKTVDTQRALVAQLTGQVGSSRAAVDAAQLQLSYTNIVAPLTGRTGIRQVDEGNIVAGSGQAIVSITQVQPISVLFNLPQQQLAQVNRATATSTVSVEAMEADNKTVIDAGQLQVIDNQVDQTTGTVRIKAEFPNADLQLWPGQFVNVRLLINTLSQVVTVPTAAVQRGPQGAFVYVAAENNRVVMRAVKVPQQDDLRAVLEGEVKAGEKIVTSGFARLKEGTEVAVATTEELEQQPVAPKRERPKGEGKRKRDGAAPSEGQPSAGTATEPGQKKNWDGRRKRQDGAAPAAGAAAPTSTSVAPTSSTEPTPPQGKQKLGQKAAEKATTSASQ